MFRSPPKTSMEAIVTTLGSGKLDDFPQKLLTLLEAVDESFLQCWHQQCFIQPCILFDESRALQLHNYLSAVVPWQNQSSASGEQKTMSSLRRDMLQAVDIALTQQWLLCHLWQICFTHDLVSADASELLFSPIFPLHCGQRARHYYQTANRASRDAHGIGLIQKLYDIGLALLQAYRVTSVSEGTKLELKKCASEIVADCRAASSAAQEFGDKLEAAITDCSLNHAST